MPKTKTKTSTERRIQLAGFVEDSGDIMVKRCSTCEKHKRCSECLPRNQRCDVRVTQSEFDFLRREKERLRQEIKDAREAQEKAHTEEDRLRDLQEKAHEASRVAFAKEMRLRQQMDLLDHRASEAIAVEEANIRELEDSERQAADSLVDFASPPGGLALNLSPHTWSAMEELPDSFWDFGGTVSEGLGSS
ncbi:hypothetical protein LTR66_005040 [Elasticomyces elasticus]|nr:hypothetical protein LTR66_005040 [Elasticomyces elasticus]